MSLKTNLFRFIFISVLGVLLHFTYEWSGDNAVVGLFSAVNESTWEHLKLLFFPFLLLTILEVLLRGNMLPEQFLPARVLGILAGMGGIVVGFYTLRGVLGRNYDALNIALYFAGVLLVIVCRKQTVSQVFSSVDESRSRCPAVAYGCIFRVHLLPAGYWIVLGSYSRPLMV